MTHRSPTGAGHVIVCGLHDEGLRVVEQLHQAGVAVTVVDDQPDDALLAGLSALDVPHHAADATSAETLRSAGVGHAAAVVCVERDDVRSLAIALLAADLVAAAGTPCRVVAQLRNPAVGRALAGIGVQVLDVAQLAAPSIVEACLLSDRRTLDLDGTSFVVAQLPVERTGTLRELFGDLAPVAVTAADASRAEVAPGRDRTVRPGETVTLVGTAAELDQVAPARRRGPSADGFVGARAPRAHDGAIGWHVQLVRMLDLRSRLTLVALGVLFASSVVALRVGYAEPGGRRMTWLDAVYFTVETVGTVGYGDFFFRDQPTWLRLWAIGLMVLGATLMTVFFALLTNLLITRRLEQALGLRRITGLKDHVVVFGAGSVGSAVCAELAARGVPVVAVDLDDANPRLGSLRAAGVQVLVADATADATLEAARLDRARAVAVTTDDDLVNLETGLAVRDGLGTRWATTPVVLRMADRVLGHRVEASFGFRFVRSPATLAAPWFVGGALGLDVLDTFYVGDEPLLVAAMTVHPGSDLDGTTMGELSADRSARIRVVQLIRADGRAEYPPRRDTRFAVGDRAHLIGPYEELLALLRSNRTAATPTATGDSVRQGTPYR